MVTVLAFAVTLLLAVLVSDRAQRSVLSTAVLFLAAGFLVGNGVLDFVTPKPDDPLVRGLAELALFSVLFTDGMRVGIRDLARAWRLPGRALLLGMPLTLGVTALLARYVAGLPWPQALLLAAVLSPTDPVFAAAIVGREEVPLRLRRLLNVESGLNDGLALPVVVVMFAVVERGPLDVTGELVDLVLGLMVGIAVAWLAIRLERLPFFAAATAYEPLNAFAIGLLVLAIASLLGVNEFLAAFAAGVTVASASPAVRDAFQRFGELVTELLKLAALLTFGALITPAFFGDIPVTGFVFAFFVLVLVRPVAIGISLLGAGLDRREWAVAAWFGPKGFASVVYSLLILDPRVPNSMELFHLVAVIIAASILAHSSTDVLVARWFRETNREAGQVPDDTRAEPEPQA